ncbi:MAG: hypothetical protein ACI4AD_00020, partial [Roseburia sp.]
QSRAEQSRAEQSRAEQSVERRSFCGTIFLGVSDQVKMSGVREQKNVPLTPDIFLVWRQLLIRVRFVKRSSSLRGSPVQKEVAHVYE